MSAETAESPEAPVGTLFLGLVRPQPDGTFLAKLVRWEVEARGVTPQEALENLVRAANTQVSALRRNGIEVPGDIEQGDSIATVFVLSPSASDPE